jgi:hypothetical protein
VVARRAVPMLLAVVVLGGLFLAVRGNRKVFAAGGGADPVLHAMEAILDRDGLGAALDSLAARAARDSTLERGGHQTAHTLGRRAVAKHGGDASIIRECRPSFASGCYHGVVEAALRGTGRIDMPELERLCRSVEQPARPGPAFECIHGLGHGVLGARRYDLQATLRDCDALSTPRLASSCHAGAFMEAINAAVGAPATHGAQRHAAGHESHAARPLAIDPADPYSPCRAYADPYAPSCWLFQGFLILRANGFDAGRALGVCDSAPGGRAARCYESVGHQLTGLLQKGDRWILEQCARGQAALAPRCAAGATLALNAMDWSGSRSAQLCAGAPEAWKDACYRTAAGSLVDLASPADRARLCATVEPGYVGSCREAGGLSEPGGRG